MTTPSWALAAIRLPDGSDRAVARLPSGALVPIDVIPDISPIDVVRRWEELAPLLRDWSPEGATPIQGTLTAPLRYPNKLLCVGANYSDHRREMATAQRPGTPFFLMKPPTTAIIVPGEDIQVRNASDCVDWEAEVAVVIGTRGRFIPEERAIEYVAGYMLVNDVSARGVHERKDPIHPAFAFDWLSSKGQDGFCPTGPAMTPSWFVPDPDAIPFSLELNGNVEQSGSTANLIVRIAGLISAASQIITREPGDMIATGTPGGVGKAKGRYLANGDEVVLASPLLGRFTNRVRHTPDGHAPTN